jgi:hypothetical protein
MKVPERSVNIAIRKSEARCVNESEGEINVCDAGDSISLVLNSYCVGFAEILIVPIIGSHVSLVQACGILD